MGIWDVEETYYLGDTILTLTDNLEGKLTVTVEKEEVGTIEFVVKHRDDRNDIADLFQMDRW